MGNSRKVIGGNTVVVRHVRNKVTVVERTAAKIVIAITICGCVPGDVIADIVCVVRPVVGSARSDSAGAWKLALDGSCDRIRSGNGILEKCKFNGLTIEIPKRYKSESATWEARHGWICLTLMS
jgi:hypothetical protein